MPPRPHVEPLSRRNRTVIFILSVLLFVVSVPLFMLYAIGYRIDFDGDMQNLRTVGGMYVSTESDLANIYVDEEIVEDLRLFQQAAYIQNIDAGLHNVHTQGENIQTWVKELPVYPHLVTQVGSFNMPSSSTVRFIPSFVTATGTPLYSVTEKNKRPFMNTVSDTSIQFVTKDPGTSGLHNPEFDYIETLFASTTEEREILAEMEAYEEQDFAFNPIPSFPTISATTTRTDGNYNLFKSENDVFVTWKGHESAIPYYFCVFTDNYASTSVQYGKHVADQLFEQTTDSLEYTIASTTLQQSKQLCRQQIKIDRKQRTVVWYEFMPDNPNLVLLQLDNGIYVVEVDDRSWQNVQQLYSGNGLTMLVDGGQIFIRDGEVYFELLTEPVNN